jgi:hypothetical protein
MVNMFGNLWLKSDEIHFGPILYTQYFRCGSTKNHESFSIIFVSSASLCFSGVDGVSRVILAESLLTVHKRVQNAQKSATLQHLRVIRKTSKDCSHNKSSNCWHSIVSEQDPEMRPLRAHSFINLELKLSNRNAQCPESSKCISIVYTTRLCLDCNLFWISECTVSIRHNPWYCKSKGQITRNHLILLLTPQSPMLKFIGRFLSAGLHLLAPENCRVPPDWATEEGVQGLECCDKACLDPLYGAY